MRWLNCVLLHGLLLLVAGATACIGGQTGSEAQAAARGSARPSRASRSARDPNRSSSARCWAWGATRTAPCTWSTRRRRHRLSRVRGGGHDARAPARAGHGQRATEAGLERLSLSVESASEAISLLVEAQRTEPTRMARTEHARTACSTSTSSARSRAARDARRRTRSTVMRLRNLPGEIRIEYLARTEDGKLLVTLVPGRRLRLREVPAVLRHPGRARRAQARQRQSRDATAAARTCCSTSTAKRRMRSSRSSSTAARSSPDPRRSTIGGDTTDLERLDPDADAESARRRQLRLPQGLGAREPPASASRRARRSAPDRAAGCPR